MQASEIERLTRELAEPVARDAGVEVIDVEYVNESGRRYLRVYIDSPRGISMDDCVAVSEGLGARLDMAQPIDESYILEVSSSGEKPLRRAEDFQRFRGRWVRIDTFAKVAGRKSFEGNLLGMVDGIVKIEVDGEEIDIPQDQISKARLAVKI